MPLSGPSKQIALAADRGRPARLLPGGRPNWVCFGLTNRTFRWDDHQLVGSFNSRELRLSKGNAMTIFPITVARVYHLPPLRPEDGAYLLVDRLWPRGVAKVDLPISAWMRDLAPSTELRKWYDHEAARWPEFTRRYLAELAENQVAVEAALDWCRKGPVTLLTASRDVDHSEAEVLRTDLTRLRQREVENPD